MSIITNETDSRKHNTWKLINSKQPKSDSNDKVKKPGVPILPADIVQGHSQEQVIGFSRKITGKFQTLVDKISLNPFVPIGVIATTVCLAKMCFASYKKDQKLLQFYMKGRIAAQGFTFAAFAAGIWYIGNCAKEGLEEKMEE
ncbi:HIG1 domain-containing protein [Meloidogyne graminicola]|uniref:HIG1 domain-containing protein n=1 Tax=Meloidogyne graminicola TaxID=189291 RepID=A0A8T0A1W3_9BILA|nr:HIG1 domain-containing protein [Meloidogyne graminicola]